KENKKQTEEEEGNYKVNRSKWQAVFLAAKNFISLFKGLCSRWSKIQIMEQQNDKTNKGDRPPKDGKRQKRITIHLTLAEYFVIQQKAEKVQIPVASYFRKAGVYNNIKASLSKEDRHFCRQLTGISHNYNHFSKLAHQEGLLSPFEHFKDIL